MARGDVTLIPGSGRLRRAEEGVRAKVLDRSHDDPRDLQRDRGTQCRARDGTQATELPGQRAQGGPSFGRVGRPLI